MASRGPKEKRRNSEKRKEKSRDAARCRRSKESDIFSDLTHYLPFCSSSTSQLDKASIMRLTIAYMKSRDLLPPAKSTSADENEDPHDFAFPSALDGFLLALSSEGDVVYVTENVNQHLGYPQMDMLGQSIYDYSHPCDHDEVRDMLTLRNETENNTRSFFLRFKSALASKGRSVSAKSAAYKVINCTSRIIRTETVKEDAPRPFYAVLIAEPIPHPSNIEIPLDGFTFLTKHSMDMKYTYIDDKIGDFLDYRVVDMEGKSAYDFHHILDHEAVVKSYKTLLAKGQCQTPVYRMMARHGGFIWLQTQATLIYGSRDTRPQAVVCVHQVLSGIESEDQILSASQQQIQAEHAPTKPVSVAKVASSVRQPLGAAAPPMTMTSKLIVPKTADMNTNTFLSFDAQSGTTVLKEEPEDLTHLAPAAGDICIPLEIPANFLSINDLIDDEDFPPDVFESFPMVGFEFMELSTDSFEALNDAAKTNGSHSSTPDTGLNASEDYLNCEVISKTASIIKDVEASPGMSDDWQTMSGSSSEADFGNGMQASPLYAGGSISGASEPPSNRPASGMSSDDDHATMILTKTTFRQDGNVEGSTLEEEDEEDYGTKAPFIPVGEDQGLPIFDCSDLFSDDIDMFFPVLPRPLSSLEESVEIPPAELSLAQLLSDGSTEMKAFPLNEATCLHRPVVPVEMIESAGGNCKAKRHTSPGIGKAPDEKKFRGSPSTVPNMQLVSDYNEIHLSKILQPGSREAGKVVRKRPGLIDASNLATDHKRQHLEPTTLRKLLTTQSEPKQITNNTTSSTASVLQNLLVHDASNSAGSKYQLHPQSAAELFPLHSSDAFDVLDTVIDPVCTALPFLSSEPDFFVQLPGDFGSVA